MEQAMHMAKTSWDKIWAARKKEGRVSAPFHSDNFRVVHDIFW